MEGPYPLEDIDEYVDEDPYGVYLLGRYADHPRYVERSDTNLLWEIKHAAFYRGRRYLYFWFAYYTSPMRAYKAECWYWHRYGGDAGLLDNLNHPARPAYTNWKCEVEGCPYSE
jgi:hypothetical protein